MKKSKISKFDAAFSDYQPDVLMEVETEDWADINALARKILQKADGGNRRQLVFWGSNDPEDDRWD